MEPHIQPEAADDVSAILRKKLEISPVAGLSSVVLHDSTVRLSSMESALAISSWRFIGLFLEKVNAAIDQIGGAAVTRKSQGGCATRNSPRALMG